MQECKVLGYARYTSKETQEEKLRINIAVKNENNGYYGLIPLKTIFLDYSDHLDDLLHNAVMNNNWVSIDYKINMASQKLEITGFSQLKIPKDEYIDSSVDDFNVDEFLK